MAASRVAAYLKPEGEVTDGGELPAFERGDKYVPYRVVGRVMGTELEGLHYKQLMPWVKPVEKTGEFAPQFVND